MKIISITALVAGGLACFAAGATASYWFVKPVLEFAETAPLYVLAEQTNVLKSLRSGEEKQITETLEQVVWIQISAHAARLSQGKPPPDTLQRDIAYHCSQLRTNSQQVAPETLRARTSWCTSLKA
jgi:hypothetical protein